MRERGYYSVRTGKHPDGAKLTLLNFKKMFKTVYRSFDRTGYFQEYFGYDCIDADSGSGKVAGRLGEDIEGALLVALRKEQMWPLEVYIDDYSEDDLFDIIEYIYDHISKPIDGYHHGFGNCGMHYSTFNRQAGRDEFRSTLNPILAILNEGYVLTEEGEILQLPDMGLAPLTDANLPICDTENVEKRVETAVFRFRKHHSSLEDRRIALRDLVDVMEYLRPKLKNVISKQDESDLFNIANNFGVRHHNDIQKTNYDAAIWYSWMFYYYLATIHACTRLIEKGNPNKDA
jgi:hypothetical protein